ncbi:MAG: toxin-antitoxin system YwqK family antitoxin [Flavobacteriales bacterium]
MKNWLLILICQGIVFSALAQANQHDSKGRKQGEWSETWGENKRKKYVGQFKDDKPYGRFTYYYESGEVSSVVDYSKNGTVAYAKAYFPNGNIMSRGKYENKLKDSVWVYFNDREGLISTENWVKGKKEGEEKIFYGDPDQSLFEINTYKNGLKNGQWKQYYKNGKILAIGTYRDDNFEGKVTYYYSSGTVDEEGAYKNAVKNGYWKKYDEDGKLLGKVYYLNGKVIEGEALEKHLEKVRAEKANTGK